MSRGRSRPSARDAGAVELVNMDDQDFRRELERTFKPIFDRHGNQGVSVGELQDELDETGIINIIPEDRMDRLIEAADRDRDHFITFREFMDMMGGLSKTERTAMQKFAGVVIQNIVPKSMRQDFMEHYTCCPPPIFMFVISIIEYFSNLIIPWLYRSPHWGYHYFWRKYLKRLETEELFLQLSAQPTKIIVFIVYAKELEAQGIATTATTGVPMYSPLLYKPTRRYEAWRYFTYMLLHQGYVHLIANLVFQLLLGLPLEIVHKWWRVMLVYFIGVIAGSLSHSLTDHWVALAGASGGCYALIGGHLASVVLNWDEMNHDCCEGNPIRFILSAPVRLALLLLLAGGDTANAVYRRFFTEGASKVGISAHIGGMLAGLLLGIPILKNINEHPWEKKLGWVTLTVFLLFVAFAVFFNGLYRGYPQTDWSPCCHE